jgi:hypothetical protein
MLGHRCKARDCKKEKPRQRHTGGQEETQTYHSDELSVSLPDVAHNPEYLPGAGNSISFVQLPPSL